MQVLQKKERKIRFLNFFRLIRSLISRIADQIYVDLFTNPKTHVSNQTPHLS